MLLYLIPTPIGNLEDITLRALRILKDVDAILAEDTRVTKKILKHYNINNKIFSFHSHNEHRVLEKWIKKLKEGKIIALVSDAGTPSVSDPGFLLVRECAKSGIDVKCLPGPTAFLPALVNSGIPCDRFVFEGFLPVKKGRKTRMQDLSVESRTMIFYESPHRILKTLKLFLLYFGEERKIAITREISKIYEETIRGTIIDLIKVYETNKPRGEFVIIVSGNKM
tara:strand:- start:642 stop:1313 length:672 start_codon:yes stop_codon:yes gene_type:complete